MLDEQDAPNGARDCTTPAPPTETVGAEIGGPSVPLCACGQPLNPDTVGQPSGERCLSGHQWQGGRGIANQGEVPPPAVPDIDGTAALKRGIAAVDMEVARIAARLNGRLTPKQRSMEQRLLTDIVCRIAPLKRELDAAEEAARAKARADAGIKVSFGGRYRPDGVLAGPEQKRNLLECLPAVFLRFIAEHYTDANLEPVDDASFFTWLDTAAQTDPQLTALVATLSGQSVEDLPLPLELTLTDEPHAHECCPEHFVAASAIEASRAAQPDRVAARFIDPDTTFTPQPPRPMLAYRKPVRMCRCGAPVHLEPVWSEFDLDRDARSAQWHREHGEVEGASMAPSGDTPGRRWTVEQQNERAWSQGTVTVTSSEPDEQPLGPTSRI